MDPINAASYLLHHVSGIMHRQSDQVLLERLGIGMSQFKLLMMLQNRPGIQQRTMAECLGQTEASVSRQTKLLIEKAMLTIKVNPKNRREHSMIITPKGVKICQAALDTLQEYNRPAFEQFSEKQQSQLRDMLKTLHAFYCQEGKPHACGRQLDL